MPFAVAVLALQSCGGEGGPIGGGGGTGNETALVAQFRGLWTDSQKAGATYVGSETCGTNGCHGTRNGEDIYTEWHETEHFGKNVGCESCHGPGSAHAASQDEADILTFPKITDAVVCGQCHGPVYNEWRESGHRDLVASPVEEAAVNPNQYGKNSRCISCHSGLFRTEINEKGVDIPGMDNALIVEIAENTMNHVPNTANCATCHNPHAKTGNLTLKGEEGQLRHPVYNDDTTNIEPGTNAATFTNFNHVCAQCHNGRGGNGADASLNSGTSRPNMHDSNQYNMLFGLGGSEGAGPVVRNMAHATAPGQCSQCHMPAGRHTFTVSYDKGCVPCHTPEDAAVRKSAVASEITSGLYVIRQKLVQWATQTYTGNPNYSGVDPKLIPYLWEYSSNISTAATDLGVPNSGYPTNHQAQIPIEIKRARHNYYFIVRDSSVCPHNPPYARHLITVANDNLDSLIGPSSFSGASANGRGNKLPSFNEMQRVLQADKKRAARSNLMEGNDE